VCSSDLGTISSIPSDMGTKMDRGIFPLSILNFKYGKQENIQK
jgi:hypothetical protein